MGNLASKMNHTPVNQLSLMSFDYWKRVVYHSCLIPIHLFCQFSGCFTWIFMKNEIQLLFIELSYLMWSIFEVEVPIFEAQKTNCRWYSDVFSFSIYSTYLMSSFTGLDSSIKCKKQMASKMLSFVHFIFHCRTKPLLNSTKHFATAFYFCMHL